MQLLLFDLLGRVLDAVRGPARPPVLRPNALAQRAAKAKPKQAKPAAKRPSRAGRKPKPPASQLTPVSAQPAAPHSSPQSDHAYTESIPIIPAPAHRESAQDRYDRVAQAMLAHYGIKVRRWRAAMSGVAWEVYYKDGSTRRFVESPRPKGPMSAAIFLHEIGHHAIGFDRYKPRCLEEYHAWVWSVRAMEANGLEVTDAVKYRMASSLHYAVAKAQRRGIRALPPELTPYLQRPAKPSKAKPPTNVSRAA